MTEEVRVAIRLWWWQTRWFSRWGDKHGTAHAFGMVRRFYRDERVPLVEMLALSGAIC